MLPFAHQLAAAVPDIYRPPGYQLHEIEESGCEKIFHRGFHRQHYFQVSRRVQGVLVMFLVAGPEMDMIVAGEKTESPQEERVEELRSEYRAVHELVEPVVEELETGAVNENCQQQDGQRPVAGGVPGGRPGQHDQAEMSQGLTQAPEITALIQVLQRCRIKRRPIPVDDVHGRLDCWVAGIMREEEKSSGRAKIQALHATALTRVSTCTGRLQTAGRMPVPPWFRIPHLRYDRDRVGYFVP